MESGAPRDWPQDRGPITQQSGPTMMIGEVLSAHKVWAWHASLNSRGAATATATKSTKGARQVSILRARHAMLRSYCRCCFTSNALLCTGRSEHACCERSSDSWLADNSCESDRRCWSSNACWWQRRRKTCPWTWEDAIMGLPRRRSQPRTRGNQGLWPRRRVGRRHRQWTPREARHVPLAPVGLGEAKQHL